MKKESTLVAETIAASKNKMSYGQYVATMEYQKPKTGPSAKDVIRLENERYRIKEELRHYMPNSSHYKFLKEELEALSEQISLYKAEMGLTGRVNTTR